MNRKEIVAWLREENENHLERLWLWADNVRRENVGSEVHLRGLIEISNYCVRQCGYCGLRFGNKKLERYRMTEDEIMWCARKSKEYGYGTVVLQSGEDYGIETDWLAGVIRRIKAETQLAVTLSMGERPDEDLKSWRAAGADRYLLRFETSDPDLYRLIHPSPPGKSSDRLAILRKLRTLGYEIGGGVMIGIPGQTYAGLANDIDTFNRLDLDMIGLGPYIPHPNPPLGVGEWKRWIPQDEQVPDGEEMTYKVISLARIVCPEANIPATTALATVNSETGRELGLMRGANVIMPGMTPMCYRVKYEIYPEKACINQTSTEQHSCLQRLVLSLGRRSGQGRGDRLRRASHTNIACPPCVYSNRVSANRLN